MRVFDLFVLEDQANGRSSCELNSRPTVCLQHWRCPFLLVWEASLKNYRPDILCWARAEKMLETMLVDLEHLTALLAL